MSGEQDESKKSAPQSTESISESSAQKLREDDLFSPQFEGSAEDFSRMLRWEPSSDLTNPYQYNDPSSIERQIGVEGIKKSVDEYKKYLDNLAERMEAAEQKLK